MKRQPQGSSNTSHVPAPDPEFFWPFNPGERRMIGRFRNGECAFRVDQIHDTWIDGTEWLGGHVVRGELDLDRPVIIAKDQFEQPMITLTLREIRDGQAWLQVTARSDVTQARLIEPLSGK